MKQLRAAGAAEDATMRECLVGLLGAYCYCTRPDPPRLVAFPPTHTASTTASRPPRGTGEPRAAQAAGVASRAAT